MAVQSIGSMNHGFPDTLLLHTVIEYCDGPRLIATQLDDKQVLVGKTRLDF